MAETIAAVDSVYRAGHGTRIVYYAVACDEVEQFTRALMRFERRLGGTSRDEFWGPLLGRLKRFRFVLSAAPLTKDDVRTRALEVAAILDSAQRTVAGSYPSELSDLRSLGECVIDIAETAPDDLLRFIESLVAEPAGRESRLLIKEPRHISAASRALQAVISHGDIQVITSSQAGRSDTFSQIVVIGAARWYPDFIFSAPRAPEIRVVYHRWLRSRWQKQSPFAIATATRTGHEEPLETSYDDTVDDTQIIDPDLILPTFDWSSVLRKAAVEVENSEDAEFEEARLCLLEGEVAVFIEASEGASVLIIDLDEEPEERVKRVKTPDLEPGMFVLLRVQGGGDYIVPLADRIMGGKASALRKQQEEWKDILRNHVRYHGQADTAHRLRQLGSKRANRPNLRNWMRRRSIRTRDYQDFRAIMRLGDRGSEAEEYWQRMQDIETAHRQAGHHIRELLLQKVIDSPLSSLEDTGYMEFELGEQDAGLLAAFRVLEISTTVTQVVPWRVGNPFKLDDV